MHAALAAIMLLLPSLLLCSSPLLVLSQTKKNVLFIGSDDLRPNLGMYSDVATGVLGGPAMHTPHLDKVHTQTTLHTFMSQPRWPSLPS